MRGDLSVPVSDVVTHQGPARLFNDNAFVCKHLPAHRTRPCTVHFEKGEPLCFITLVPSIAIEGVQPVIRPLNEAPNLQREYKVWDSKRNRFNCALDIRDPIAMEQKWQKHDLLGKSPTGRSVADDTHRVKRSLKAPIQGKDEAS